MFSLSPDPPEVSLFQKDSLSPVVCDATGFYPKPVNISWKENGEDLDADVELREMLPTQNRTSHLRKWTGTNTPPSFGPRSLEKMMVTPFKPDGTVEC